MRARLGVSSGRKVIRSPPRSGKTKDCSLTSSSPDLAAYSSIDLQEGTFVFLVAERFGYLADAVVQPGAHRHLFGIKIPRAFKRLDQFVHRLLIYILPGKIYRILA